ncbi:hypothetical protein [Bradyrhizobium sp. CCGUVB23]|uniref:hypothetical protein n=1 Tax=Bradyrhizobium sp. CCGUVB23 TaxID=2949630 RepID=UPI0020B27B6C|nr:hypothetical protein [Bradyrhizobium sp. CCGUVB23]MCP3462533.1 hypothetical protein [Bradyrhizobium sp. CCGUVB23]
MHGDFDPAIYQDILKAVRAANEKITEAEHNNSDSLAELRARAAKLEALITDRLRILEERLAALEAQDQVR